MALSSVCSKSTLRTTKALSSTSPAVLTLEIPEHNQTLRPAAPKQRARGKDSQDVFSKATLREKRFGYSYLGHPQPSKAGSKDTGRGPKDRNLKPLSSLIANRSLPKETVQYWALP